MTGISRFTQHNISRALDAIARNDHNCDTVKSLIVDLRPCCPKGSIIREFGDFIAHPDEKDRGIIHRNISDTFNGMVRFFRASNGLPVDGPARFSINPSFTDTGIVDSLFSVLTGQNLIPPSDLRWPRLHAQRGSICVCLLSLIQGVTFLVGKHRIPGFISIVPGKSVDSQPVERLWFTANIPSELLMGDKFIDVVFPVIDTNLNALDWVVGPLPKQNSGRCIFVAQTVDQRIRLVPIETIPG